ncbi:MAG: hypothetical protein ACM31L_06015 [Actinomycetota bacterium]
MPLPQEISFHSIIRAPVAGANGRILPILILVDGEVFTLGVEWLCSQGLVDKASKTLGEAVKAIGLLYDYYYAAYRGRSIAHDDIEKLLLLFGEALLYGTINENGDCPFGLYWRARPDRAARLTRYVEKFCKFVSGQNQLKASGAELELLNTAIRSWGCVDKRYEGSLLSHLRNSRRTMPSPSLVRSRGSVAVNEGRPTPFPEEYIVPLLIDGCKRQRCLSDRSLPENFRKYNVRNQLAFLLLLGGGLRTEELFHIFANDVYPMADGRARVNLYHPVRGAITWRPLGSASQITTQRDRFLRERYGTIPRNLYDDKHSHWAGWKGLLLTHGAPLFYTEVFWIYPTLARLFLHLHTQYIAYVRSRCGAGHPYYFISLGRSSMGDPWTVASFQEAWQGALKKIGLSQNKLLGTNPHAARHWYGQRAADLGIDPRIRQVMMHHRNVISQLRYQRPSAEQVNHHIENAQKRMLSAMGRDVSTIGEDAVLEKFDDVGMESLLLTTEQESLMSPLEEFGGRFDCDPAGVMSSWKLFRQGANCGSPI